MDLFHSAFFMFHARSDEMTISPPIRNFQGQILASWPLILLIGFGSIYLPTVAIVGYRWTVEISLAAFLLLVYLSGLRSASAQVDSVPNSELLWIMIPIALLTLWSGLSVFWAASWRSATHHALLWGCYLSFYVFIRSAISDSKITRSFIVLAGIVLFAISLAGVTEFIGSPKPITALFTSRWYLYAEVIVMFLPIFAVTAIKDKPLRSFLWILNIAICWILVVATTSRIMFIAGISATVLFTLLVWLRYPLSLVCWKWAAIAVVMIGFTLIPQLSRLQGERIALTDRLSGTEEHSIQSARSRLLFWGMAIEGFRRSPLIGVGGDNYYSGYKFLRENYSLRYPANPVLEISEDFIPERAHNEYLQILCELGLVGGLLFAWLLFGIAYMFIRAIRNGASLLTLGALSGIAAFLVASAASSYSFRFPANGLCFFFLLAVAANGTFGKNGDDSAIKFSPTFHWLFVAIGIAVSVAMIAFSVVRAVSINHLANFQNTKDKAVAEGEIKRAIAIDGEEPMFRFYFGEHLYLTGRYDEAIPQLRLGIDDGLATSPAYFELLAALMASGRNDEALTTFNEALRVYPRSVFLRTAYASFLKRIGETSRANVEYSNALAINEKQARSWQLAHDEGLERLAQVSRVDDTYASTFDLKPVSAPLSLANFQSMGR
jgi:O-antigen ligase